MVLTIKFIEDSFKRFNEEFFNGTLRKPAFKIMHTKSLLGQCAWKREQGRPMRYCIRISDYYKRDEKQYQNTIIHEMIHLFIRQNNIRDTRAHHGKAFYKYADFINGYGWNIARTDDISGLDINVDKTITYHLAAFRDEKGKYFLFRYNPKYERYFLTRFQRKAWHYQDVFTFTSTDNRKYAKYTNCRKSVRGYYITKAEYENLKTEHKLRLAV